MGHYHTFRLSIIKSKTIISQLLIFLNQNIEYVFSHTSNTSYYTYLFGSHEILNAVVDIMDTQIACTKYQPLDGSSVSFKNILMLFSSR